MIGGEEHRAGVEGSGADVHHILEVLSALGAPPQGQAVGTPQVPAQPSSSITTGKSGLPEGRAESGPELQVPSSNLVGTFPKTAGKYLELGKDSQTSTTAMVLTHRSDPAPAGWSTWRWGDPCTQQMPTEEAD